MKNTMICAPPIRDGRGGWASYFALALWALWAFGCERKGDEPTTQVAALTSVRLVGSGASFPAALYEVWVRKFNQQHDDVSVSYDAKGSGGGIDDFLEQRVDFACSDAALSDADLIAQGNTALMLPVTAGGIVLGYRLDGVQEPLRLSREVYAGIFKGVIRDWGDPRIVELNPGLSFPEFKEITVVHRSDPSGTTWVFLNHLDALPHSTHVQLGTGLWGRWSVGIAANGNSGVAKKVSEIDGAIGYVQQIAAQKQGLSEATLENRDGTFVRPTLETVAAALEEIGLAGDLRAWMPDPVGKNSYPISTYTWLLVDREAKDAATAHALQKFLRFALNEGQKESAALGYVPLSPKLSARVAKAVELIQPSKEGAEFAKKAQE